MGYLQRDINIPPKEKVAVERTNFPNIPYLYLASNKQTACAECRCSLMDILSIMELKITQDITVIDLTKDNVHFSGLDSIFFNRIKKSLIKNCTNKSDVFYVQTQYIASYFYNLGVNGIKYLTTRESNNESYNFLLFSNDCVKAKSKRASIYICTKSSFIFKEINLPNNDKIVINGNMINGQQNATQQRDEISKKYWV